MRNTTSEEKQLLRSLWEHPWFKVWMDLCEDYANELWRKLIDLNLDDEYAIKIIKLRKAQHNLLTKITKYIKKWQVYSPTKKTEEELLKHF